MKTGKQFRQMKFGMRLLTLSAGFIASVIFSGCEEFDKQALIVTEVATVSDSVIVTNSKWIDIDDQGATAYGVCWGVDSNPTVDDDFVVVETPPVDGTSLSHVIRRFEANKTYFIRAFARFSNGEFRYSNVVSAETGEVLGRWTKLSAFFKSSPGLEIQDYDWDENGILDTTRVIGKRAIWFPTGAFFGETPFLGSGIFLEGTSTIDANGDTSTWPSSAFLKKYTLFKFYENNEWSIRVAYPGAGYRELVTHVVDNFVYMGMGSNGGYSYYDFHTTQGQYQELWPCFDFYAYDLANDLWIRRQNFPGPPRMFPVSFAIGRKIYVFGGCDISGESLRAMNDLWVYDIDADEWTEGPRLFASAGFHAAAFVADGKGYVGGGFEFFNEYQEYEDGEIVRTPIGPINRFYEFDPLRNEWTIIAPLPAEPRGGSVAFGIQGHGYVGLGFSNGQRYKDFWRYTPATGTWKKMSDFPGPARSYGTGFSNETRGCVGLGDSEHFDSHVWIYDPSRN